MKFQLILMFLVLFLVKKAKACAEGLGGTGGGMLAALTGGQESGGEEAQKVQRGILKALNSIAFRSVH